MQVYKIIHLLWILLIIFSIIYLIKKWCNTVCEAVSCLKIDSVSFTDLSEKLLHRQSDSSLDEVIESLFKEILTLDGAAKLQDSQVCKTKLSWNLRKLLEIMCYCLVLSLSLSLFMLKNRNLVNLLIYLIKKILIFVVGGNRHTVVELGCDQTCWLNYYRRAKGQRSLSVCLLMYFGANQSVCLFSVTDIDIILFPNILTKESLSPDVYTDIN